MTDSTKVKVKARSFGYVGYSIPEDGINRMFTYGETKEITLGELKKLQYIDGGQEILQDFLIVQDEEALKELNMNVEPEYFYTEEEVKAILQGTTEESVNQLEDALNFAPEGTIDLIKSLAVSLEIPDNRKRKMISEKTGVNIDGAINLNHMYDDIAEDAAEDKKAQRKASPVQIKKAEPARKSEPVKVVSTAKK